MEVSTRSDFLLSLWERLGEGPDFVGIATGRFFSSAADGNKMQKLTPFLWYDTQAEEAANFYVSIFKNSKILDVARYGKSGPGPEGSVMIVSFEVDGQKFTALNAGPRFKFTEAISFVVNCETQEEIDYYWEKMTSGGGDESR